jgi:hypothetical protein
VPRRIMPTKDALLLGTGKFDYVTAQKMVNEKFAATP